jgi:hypothetical protein
MLHSSKFPLCYRLLFILTLIDLNFLIRKRLKGKFLILAIYVGLKELFEGTFGEFCLQSQVLLALGVVHQQTALLGRLLQLRIAAHLHLVKQILVDEVHCHLLQILEGGPILFAGGSQQQGAFPYPTESLKRCGRRDGFDRVIHEVIYDLLGLNARQLYRTLITYSTSAKMSS